MKDTVHIVVSRAGFQRATKTDRIELKPGERYFPLELEVPDEAFAPPALPRVRMVITPAMLAGPIEVDLPSGDDEPA